MSSRPQRSLPLPTIIVKAVSISAVLLVGLVWYLMGRLRIESIEMRHMDPTDIVRVPLDWKRLTIYVAGVTLGSFGLSSSSSCFFLVGHWMQASMAYWVIAVVCGAPPTRDIYHTVTASVYLATLTVVLPESAIPTRSQLALPPWPRNDKNNVMSDFSSLFLATCQVHATLFLTVPFQVLRLYDWGSQIQRWPLPILLGSTYGFVLGSLLGSAFLLALRHSPSCRGWYDTWTSTSPGQVQDQPHRD